MKKFAKGLINLVVEGALPPPTRRPWTPLFGSGDNAFKVVGVLLYMKKDQRNNAFRELRKLDLE